MPSLAYPPRVIRRLTYHAGTGLRRHLPTARSRAEHARGTDAAGRFIGARDVERGFDFFMRSRGQAPRVRQALPAGVELRLAEFAPARAVPSGRPAGSGALSLGALREVWAARQAGATYAQLAEQFGVSLACIKGHMARGGSASMRAARAAA